MVSPSSVDHVFTFLIDLHQTHESQIETIYKELLVIRDVHYKEVLTGKRERSYMIENFFAFLNRKELRRFYDPKSKLWFEQRPEDWWDQFAEMREKTMSPTSQLYDHRISNRD